MRGIAAVSRSTINVLALVCLAIVALLPVVDAILRTLFLSGIPAASQYVVYSVLFLTFLAAVVATREKQHIGLAAAHELLPQKLKTVFSFLNAFVALMVVSAMFFGSVSQVMSVSGEEMIGFLPLSLLLGSICVGLFMIAVYIPLKTDLPARLKAFTLLALIPGIFLSLPDLFFQAVMLDGSLMEGMSAFAEGYGPVSSILFWPLLAVILFSALSGAPVFAVLGGLAVLLYTSAFATEGYRAETVVNAAHQLFKESESTISAIPLLTVSGYILSSGNTGKRLVELFKSMVGWIPGGLVIVVVIVSAFFTTFTGATGVTILALGSLLSYILTESGHCDENFSHGLLTASGSIGLLFPPSLAVILYGMVAQIDIMEMFKASFLPGTILVLSMCAMGLAYALRKKVPTTPFEPGKLLASLKNAAFELLLPLVILSGWAFGFMTLAETGPFVLIYVIVVEVFILKEISLKDLPSIVIKAISVVGGAMIILVASKGLAQFVIDRSIPDLMAAWMTSFISNPAIFLLIVNLILLVVGCFMDILSATIVVAPFIISIGTAYGIDPYHLGVIFIMNMSIGFLTPPVGMNLFLASYTFKRKLPEIYRLIIPYFLVQLAVVLLITYVPWFSTVLISH